MNISKPQFFPKTSEKPQKNLKKNLRKTSEKPLKNLRKTSKKPQFFAKPQVFKNLSFSQNLRQKPQFFTKPQFLKRSE